MKPGKSLSVLAFTVLLAFASAPALLAQAPPEPGPEHDALKKREGEWIATVKSDTGDSTGTMTLKMECGGLWLVSDFKSSFGDLKFQGRGFDGYDPVRKKYVSVWVDSMTAQPLFLEGERDAAKKTVTMTGKGTGPDGNPTVIKTVTHLPDDDHHTFNMYMVGADGKETKILTVEYVRKKS